MSPLRDPIDPGGTGRIRRAPSSSSLKLMMMVVAAVEVAARHDDPRVSVRHPPSRHIAPFSGTLMAGFDGLGAGVHRQHRVFAARSAVR